MRSAASNNRKYTGTKQNAAGCLMTERACAEIDLGAVKENIDTVRRIAGPGVKILLPVKSDGYGHGAVEVSRYVERHRLVEMVGVASLSEGIELRSAGITLPVLNFGVVLPDIDRVEDIVRHSITQTVVDRVLPEKISAVAGDYNAQVSLHLKIDTGMGRIGCPAGSAVQLVEEIQEVKNVLLEGIYSHFPIADVPDADFTKQQISRFREIINELESRGYNIPLKHIANSAAILYYPESYFTMVRPGIMSYGYYPSPLSREIISLNPAMTLKGRVVLVKRVAPGTPLSYGHTYETKKETTIATVSVGYGDGYSRSLSNRGEVLIRGRRYPVAGTVCMDLIMVDLGDDDCSPGDEVILFGKEIITADIVADWIGTIPYEVTCLISGRVPRRYSGNNDQ